MGRPLKIKKYAPAPGQGDVGYQPGAAVYVDTGYPAFNTLTDPVYPGTMAATEFYGVVGGSDTVASAQFPTVEVRVKIGSNAEANGYIIRQKGSIKYLVSDGTNVGVCVLANLADNTLTANTMTITVTDDDSTPRRISKLTNKWALDYTGGSGYSAAEVLQRIRWLANFFDAGSTAIKSGTTGQQNTAAQQNIVTLALVENYT